MKINSNTLMTVLSLSDDERRNLAEILGDVKYDSREALSGLLSSAMKSELEHSGAENRKQVEALKKIPVAVNTANALEQLDDLVHELSIIRDAARETDEVASKSLQEVEGHYKMLFTSLDAIVERMLDVFASNDNDIDVFMAVTK